MQLFAVAACSILPLAVSIAWKAPILLVWNSSASAPVGLYRVHPGAPVRRGDMAVAWTPGEARSLAANRHYLPANVPLVKRVAASQGDNVCASGSTVRINGRTVAARLDQDSAGRPMPWWSGCLRLGAGEYLLLMDRANSFDGRYFGRTSAADVVGKADLLWER